ncbi:hypothetical protein I7I48_00849 [Histoplasma ohiense]|nr:hypothetical protein I7I48_00849 [Histoplasma ohiense (nom. inval.)]
MSSTCCAISQPLLKTYNIAIVSFLAFSIMIFFPFYFCIFVFLSFFNHLFCGQWVTGTYGRMTCVYSTCLYILVNSIYPPRGEKENHEDEMKTRDATKIGKKKIKQR